MYPVRDVPDKKTRALLGNTTNAFIQQAIFDKSFELVKPWEEVDALSSGTLIGVEAQLRMEKAKARCSRYENYKRFFLQRRFDLTEEEYKELSGRVDMEIDRQTEAKAAKKDTKPTAKVTPKTRRRKRGPMGKSLLPNSQSPNGNSCSIGIWHIKTYNTCRRGSAKTPWPQACSH
ncbi:hypothetical protein IMY05_C4590000600 [Salix suchowensis]|nr:hypothetical protein IMY05_C4590000600 [Salix suchowensis]